MAGGFQAYTLFTSMFLHANLVHLIFNLFALIFVGMAFESRIGSTRFFLIAMIAGLVGGMTWAAVHWGENAFAVGASGAVLGAIGGFARLFGRERLRMILFIVPLPPMPAYVIFVMLLLIDLVIALTSVLPIAAEAHIGGAIAGFLIAPYILKVPTRHTRAERTIAIHISTLEALATTRELEEILDKIEKETVPEVQKVWFTHFMQKAKCPNCGGPLGLKGDTLYSECGWRTRL